MTTTATHARSASRIGALMAMGSMVSVQLGLAIAVGLIGRIGVEGAAWIRLAWGGLLFLVIVRPRAAAFTRSSFAACVLLGVVTATITMLFMAALNRPVKSSEQAKILAAMRGVRDKDLLAPWQDLFWALLNSNEFLLNH